MTVVQTADKWTLATNDAAVYASSLSGDDKTIEATEQVR
jgi:hypothetical protein